MDVLWPFWALFWTLANRQIIPICELWKSDHLKWYSHPASHHCPWDHGNIWSSWNDNHSTSDGIALLLQFPFSEIRKFLRNESHAKIFTYWKKWKKEQKNLLQKFGSPDIVSLLVCYHIFIYTYNDPKLNSPFQDLLNFYFEGFE